MSDKWATFASYQAKKFRKIATTTTSTTKFNKTHTQSHKVLQAIEKEIEKQL